MRRVSEAVLVLASLALAVACSGKGGGAADAGRAPADAEPIDAAPPPPPIDAAPAPALPPVEGASKEAGQALYVKLCGSCHGPDGRGSDGFRGDTQRNGSCDLIRDAGSGEFDLVFAQWG